MKSRICINTLALRTGGGLSYVAELVPHIQKLHGAASTRVLVTRSQLDMLGWSNAEGVIVFPNFLQRPSVRLLFEALVLPVALIIWRCRSLLMCGNVGILLCPVRQVVVQHASYQAAAANRAIVAKIKWHLRRLMGRATCAAADSVVYVSAALQSELLALGFPAGHIVHHGVNPLYRAIDRSSARASVRSGFGLHMPFLLCVSDVYPHKNLTLAVHALHSLRKAGHPTMTLVIAGAPEDQAEAGRLNELCAQLGLSTQVHMLGRVQRSQLRDLYNAAEVVLAASTAESFGMPLLEALRCGVPVVCSHIPAFREVAGGVGLFFDPHDVHEATQRLLEAMQLPRPFEQGIEHARPFSWEGAARLTLHALAPVHAGPDPRLEPDWSAADQPLA